MALYAPTGLPFPYSQHVRGAWLGDRYAGGGLFRNMPEELLQRRQHSIYFTDFHDLETEWTATNATSGTIDITQDGTLGLLAIDAGAVTNNQGLTSVQYTGADLSSEGVATPAAGRIIAWEARVKIAVPSTCDWFIGLGETDTTFLTAATGAISASGGDNFVGFHHVSGAAGVASIRSAGAGVANIATHTAYKTLTIAADTFYHFGCRIEGTNKIRFYLDDVPVSDWVTISNAFDDNMTPTFALLADGTDQSVMTVDYVMVAQSR